MRLLDTYTGQFIQKDPGHEDTLYAVLSHTWSHNPPEDTYKQLKKIQRRYATQPQDSQTSVQGVPPSPLSPLSSLSPSLAQESMTFLPYHTSSMHKDPSPAATITTKLHPKHLHIPLSPIWDDPELSPKVRNACAIARAAGYRYFWVDSCCIDKSSSSELSEAINSMYYWYSRAAICYAFLADVPPGEDPRAAQSSFRRSRYHTRGWTLQELIAPVRVMFLSNDWQVIGSKHSLADLLEEISGIPDEALLHIKSLDEFSLAQRLSWAAKRETTRVEDRAYSLLGIVNINMPTLYGEGHLAFRRLQEELVRRVPDQSLFAWENVYDGIEPGEDILEKVSQHIRYPVIPGWQRNDWVTMRPENERFESLITDYLGVFAKCGKIRAISHEDVFRRLSLPHHLPAAEYTFTPHGIRTQLPLIPVSVRLPGIEDECATSRNYHYLAILGCEHASYPDHLLGRFCYIPLSDSGIDFLYTGYTRFKWETGELGYYGLFPLSPTTIERCRTQIQLKTVYIWYPGRSCLGSPAGSLRKPHQTISLILLRKTRDALRTRGYTAELRGPDQDHPTAHWLTLSNHRHTIVVEFHHTLEDGGREFRIRVNAKMSPLRTSAEALPPAETQPGRPGAIVFRDSMRVRWQTDAGVSSDYTRPWQSSLREQQFVFDPETSKKLVLTLGMDLAPGSFYALHVDVVSEILPVGAHEVPSDDRGPVADVPHVQGEDKRGAKDVRRAVDDGPVHALGGTAEQAGRGKMLKTKL
ncbi:hypothetical protein BD309DRAFT_1009961 [Dichomitus squalens]|nr:hypothetical protein BD309DRAFT_1009961 [Dichomitus squalens]